MKIAKKIVLSLSVALTMAIAFVIGLVGLNNKPVNTNSPINKAETNQIATNKPTTYTYNPGEFEIVEGGGTINYSYQPDTITNNAIVKAYEYQFSSVNDDEMAVAIKSIDTTDVEVSYAWSNEKLDTTQTITSQAEYPTQILQNKGDKLYVYILVSPTNEAIPTTFTQKIVWYYGKAGQVQVYNSDGTVNHTQTIVKGQPAEVIITVLVNQNQNEDIKFDGLYMDSAFTIPVNSSTQIQGGEIYARYSNLPSDWLTLDNDHYVVTKGTSALPSNLVIPSYYEGLPVTHIADGDVGAALGGDFSTLVFGTQTGLTNIDLPNTMTYVGAGAFGMCSNLTSVNLETCTNLNTLGAGCFAQSGLTSIVIPASVTYIGMYTFYGCSALTSVTLTDNDGWFMANGTNGTVVASLADMAYVFDAEQGVDIYDPMQLSGVLVDDYAGASFSKTMPESTLPSDWLTLDGDHYVVTRGTSELPLTIIIPSHYNGLPVTQIADSALSGQQILSVTLSSTITHIGESAFQICYLLYDIDFSRCTNLISIGYGAFKDSQKFTSIDLSACTSLTTIDDYAFNNCRALTNIDLSGCTNLTTIGNCAFEYCKALTDITIPASVTKIGYDAFDDCDVLTSITFEEGGTWYYTSNSDYTGGTEFTIVADTNYATEFKSTYSSKYWYKV